MAAGAGGRGGWRGGRSRVVGGNQWKHAAQERFFGVGGRAGGARVCGTAVAAGEGALLLAPLRLVEQAVPAGVGEVRRGLQGVARGYPYEQSLRGVLTRLRALGANEVGGNRRAAK